MTQFSVQWILSLNPLSQKSGQVQTEVPLSYDAVAQGRDNQLDAAIEMVKSM